MKLVQVIYVDNNKKKQFCQYYVDDCYIALTNTIYLQNFPNDARKLWHRLFCDCLNRYANIECVDKLSIEGKDVLCVPEQLNKLRSG